MKPETRNQKLLFAVVVIQLLLLTVIVLGDFGFYFPGSMGDLGVLMGCLCVYLFLLLIGVVAALTIEENRSAIFQITVPVITLLAVWASWYVDDAFVQKPEPPDATKEL